MDEALREEAERAAEAHALYNALAHDGEANVGALMGPLMADHPELRPHGDTVAGIAAQIVGTVNDLDPAAKRNRLEELAPELLTELDAPEETDDRPLPDLPNVEDVEQVRMRLAPNPNGPWHIGHARMPAVIGRYKDRYDGWFVCRFDDTDPETKRPDLDAYDWILEDIDYLGFEPDEVLRASDRLETYYEYARELIDRGGAYTCSCPAEHFSDLKNAGEECDHRGKEVETIHEEFDRMVAGSYEGGEMVLRIRTDISHPNPALRDWVGFRMIDTPHPREEAADYRCWPMLDFQSGIDDHLTGVTHIIRGIDLQDSARRQSFVYDYFGWEYPEVIHWGHVQVDAYNIRLSTSRIRERIESGELDGWDDPRAPTLRSLRRRGIHGEAIVEAMVELGTSTSNVDLSMSTIYARNRERIDEDASRCFLVRDGVERTVIGGPDTAAPPVHPDHPARGNRDITVTGSVLVEPADLPPNGERVWLKGYGCVRHTRDAFEFTGDDIDVVREHDVPVIHWVPTDDSIPVTLRRPTGDETGQAEAGLADVPIDEIIQFERIGFARIDAQTDEATITYFAHR